MHTHAHDIKIMPLSLALNCSVAMCDSERGPASAALATAPPPSDNSMFTVTRITSKNSLHPRGILWYTQSLVSDHFATSIYYIPGYLYIATVHQLPKIFCSGQALQ